MPFATTKKNEEKEKNYLDKLLFCFDKWMNENYWMSKIANHDFN